jgi:hypothetical protein
MANNQKGNKGRNKKDKKAATASVRKCKVHKIKASKEHRGCGPIGRKLKALHAEEKQGKAAHISNLEERNIASSYAARNDKPKDEKHIKGSSQLYHELLAQWSD